MSAARNQVGAAVLASLLVVPCAVRPAFARPPDSPPPADEPAAEAGAPSAAAEPETLPSPQPPASEAALEPLGSTFAPPLGATASFGTSHVLLPRLQLPPLSLDRGAWSGAPLAPSEPAPPHVPPAASEEVVDDRSGWAKWNSSLAGVTSSLVAVDLVCLGAFTLLPNEWTGWEDPEFKGLKENFTIGPRVDNDRWAWNYIAHPVTGAEYYLLARNREHSWYASFAYSAGMSTFWEFFVESAYEQASWQDIFITPVAGAALGELRWQIKRALVNPSTGRPVGPLKKVLYVLIDPFDAVTKL